MNAERTCGGHSSGNSPGETPLERRRRLPNGVTEDFKRRRIGLDTAENLPRTELYDRDRARAEANQAAEKEAWSPAESSGET